MKKQQPLACVMGDMDLIRPLGMAGIECAVAVPLGAGARYSRFTRHCIDWFSPWEKPEALVDALVSFGKSQRERPVLYFQSDAELLLVSRNRKRLEQVFRFAIADATLVEDLVDKERFQALAERLALPVPRALKLPMVEKFEVAESQLNYPVVVKPLTRRPTTWKAIAPAGKALRIDSEDQMRDVWPRIKSSGVDVLLQELIPGPETSVLSYHVYVDDSGEILGEFTGRKLRTYPREYGDSTALEITNERDVAELGRNLVQQLGLTGVAKFDFKRATNERLYLLEVNPRFNLWHHPGAVAGVNLPAIVFKDLVEKEKPATVEAKVEVKWSRVWQDFQAARAERLALGTWLSWTIGCDAKRLLSLDDPMPFVGAVLWRIRERLQARRHLLDGPVSAGDSSQAMRVLMVTSEWPKPGVNLTAHFIKRQADYVSAAGVEVDVFAFKGEKNPWKYMKAWFRLRRKLKDGQYDLIHAQFGQSGLLAIPKRLPLVVTFRGSDLLGTVSDRTRHHLRASKIHQILSRMVARQADAVIVVAEHMKEHLPTIDAHVIPSGIDFKMFRRMDKQAARTRLNLPVDEKLVLFVGRTNHARKRGWLAEQAVEILNQTVRARLVIAWRVAHSDIPLYMSACDALVFTSMQEGSPNVVKEALACDLPVVSVSVGDVASRIEGIDGCELCADDDPQRIAAALGRVLERNERIAGRQAVAALDEELTTRRVINIYKSVTRDRKATATFGWLRKARAGR